MEKVLTKMDSFYTELKRIEDKTDTRTTMILWAIGVMIALVFGLKLIG